MSKQHKHWRGKVAGGSPQKVDRSTQLVVVDQLAGPVFPRVMGVSESHARLLAEVFDRLPPVLVQRDTLRIIDGMHRVRAAAILGQCEIEVELFDGTEEEAFVRSIADNISHGMPLSLADRRNAALRALASQPEWSDRRIAELVGLSASTVGALRGTSSPRESVQARVGKDGRARPLNSEHSRRRIVEILKSSPGASLRQVARAAGVSPATVRDVRERLERGDDPVRLQSNNAPSVADDGASGDRPTAHTTRIDWNALDRLSRDPSVVNTEIGRRVVRFFHAVRRIDSDELLRSLPEHSYQAVSETANACASQWQLLAGELERRSRIVDSAEYRRD
ncbi:ParB/RepB/Spo0J family partition protein [Phytoactinopolyspora limicola]|uniref:ParB/RepB/Spo0J family partition protein n=1 Tax=Phytoactinopolyspora limicola TaxID=2715536 RepID=UPI00140BB6F7|nr:ParB/RepB/Spo0J family partition protein [Phytoactinopolyspora limicola]